MQCLANGLLGSLLLLLKTWKMTPHSS